MSNILNRGDTASPGNGGGGGGTPANNSVGPAQLKNGAVTEPKIGAGAVTETKIGASAVTQAKLASGAVSASQIEDGSVTAAKLGSDVSQSAGGNNVSRLRNVATDILSLSGYAYTASAPSAAGQFRINASTRLLEVYPLSTHSTLFQLAFIEGMGVSIVRQASGPQASVVGSLGEVSQSSGVFSSTLSAAGFASVGTFAASDPARIQTTGLFITKSTLIAAGNLASNAVIEAKIADGAVTRNKIAANAINGDKIADSSVDLAHILYDGTAAAGKVLKVYSKSGGGLGLQIADDNSGGGGGSNITLPLDLASSTNFSGLNPIARGGTGASTAAGARAALGVAAAGGGSAEAGQLQTVTAIDAQAVGHIGEYVSASTGKPDSGSESGIVARLSGGDQIAVVGEDGTTYYRTHSTSVDANWTLPSTPTLTQVTTIAQMRAITNYQIVESTFAAGNPQGTARALILRVPGGFGGHGYLAAIPPGGLGFWVTEIPSASFAATDLTWATWENAPLPYEFENLYVHRAGAYDKVPAGQAGLVLDLQIRSTVVADAFVTHTYTSSTTSSSYKADYYTTGNSVRESTRGHDHTIGTWAKAQVGNEQIKAGAVDADSIADSLVIKESDGTAVSRMKVPQLEDIVLSGYEYTTNTTPAAGQVNYNSASRAFRGRARAGDEVLLSELIQTDFEFSITKTSSGQAASVRGVFDTISPVVQGVFQGQYRSDDITEVGDFAAGDTITLRGHKAVYNKLDTIPPVGLGIGHGSSQANHLVMMNASGSAFTAGTLAAANLPVLLADLRDIGERLTIEQLVRGKTFGSAYAHSASASGVTVGRIRWDETGRILTIHPLAADTTLPEYLLPGVQLDVTSSNSARILGTIEAVVANPANTPSGAYSVRIADTDHHYTGDIRSGTITIKTNGAFRGRDEDVHNIADDSVGINELNTTGSGTDGQALVKSGTRIGFANITGGGGGSGDTFDEDAYSSKAFGLTTGTDYGRQGTLANLAARQVYWDSTNSRATIAPPTSGDTDIGDYLVSGTVADFRVSGGDKLRGPITRIDNPSGSHPAGTFTVQFDTANSVYFKSSGFDASTADITIHALGKVVSLTTENTTIPGGFGIINRDFLDLASTPSNGQVLGFGSNVAGDRRIFPVTLPVIPRHPDYRINIQSSIDNTNISGTTFQPLLDGTGVYTVRMEIANAGDWFELISDGVCNCSSGLLQAVGVEVGWQFRTATSESGLSSATYEEADTQRRGHGMGDTAYRTKQAGGGSGGTAPRDLWVLSNDWVSLSHISSNGNPTTAGRWIEFRVQHRLPDSAFSGSFIDQRYGFQIKMTCLPSTNIINQS